MTAPFQANGHATLIGSIPLTDHDEALDLIMEYTPEIPLWPQLPCRSEEKMLVQFIEGFPGAIETEGKAYFQTDSETFMEGLLPFFEEYLAVSDDSSLLLDSRFSTSKLRAPGIYTLVEKPATAKAIALKGQITGPFTLLVGLTDHNKRLGYYDPTIREMIVKGIALKAAWQVSFLKKAGLPTLLFLDEPALAGLGSSSYISISKEDIATDLTESITAIHQAGGLAGVHVCANTDWNMLLQLDLDIVSFDAFGFFDKFITSKSFIIPYLKRGGIIAWGGIPTSDKEDIDRQTKDSLCSLWESHMDLLAEDGFSKEDLLKQTLITPSCGTGSLDIDRARKVLQLCHDVSAQLRKKYSV